jgi:hypothetical protein
MQVAQMKLAMTKAMIPVTALVAALAGCGGGGDAEAGAPTGLNVQPSTITITGNCGGGYAGQVFVYGGAGPYRIDNTFPDLVSLDKKEVDGPGGSFNVTYLGGCFEPALVVIVDKLNRQVVLTLNNKVATTTTTP